MYQFKIFVNGTQEVRGEAKVYHAAMMEAIRYMAQYKWKVGKNNREKLRKMQSPRTVGPFPFRSH